jgi:hypothetical protein
MVGAEAPQVGFGKFIGVRRRQRGQNRRLPTERQSISGDGAQSPVSARVRFAQRSRYSLSILQKLLAQDTPRSQAHSAMSTFARPTNRGRTLVAVCVSAAFLWALALSASPQLHQRVHKDANRVEHNCAATMIASGNYDHVAHPPLVSAPASSVQFSKIPALTPRWVQSPFLGACIFEHAPPARA